MTGPERASVEMLFGKPLAELFRERGYRVESNETGISVIDPNPVRPTHHYVQIFPVAGR